MQTFDSMDDKKLQEYYKLMYGSEVKVEKMELVKVFKKATKIYYPDVMKDVLPLKEFVKNITDKGYKVELTKDNVVSDTVVNIYKEVEMEE